ncbi:MAG: 4-hydroxy-3-methylbut-2-enyl diphosphate reductase [Lachnospiraceae bacterium]|nr:4-hydroxy-3-methylbut-2-enyl diphosphate reductase [Lachnospiraceae bacterium]
MNIKLAKTAGFCFGVERAVDLTLKNLETDKKVYTWGPPVHNEYVIREMEEKGAVIFDPEDSLDSISEGATVVLRAHGVSRETEEALRKRGLNLVDAACPFVKKIHKTVEKYSKEGAFILICGDPSHPEVQGIVGWCAGDYAVAENDASAVLEQLPKERLICVVAQTTFRQNLFQKIVDKIADMNYNTYIANTICSATRDRQEEAAAIASQVDVMLVVGSASSSNSQKLYTICNEHCSHTYFIQSVEDICQEWFQDVKDVGITAGASTPKKIFEEVQNHVGEF